MHGDFAVGDLAVVRLWGIVLKWGNGNGMAWMR